MACRVPQNNRLIAAFSVGNPSKRAIVENIAILVDFRNDAPRVRERLRGSLFFHEDVHRSSMKLHQRRAPRNKAQKDCR